MGRELPRNDIALLVLAVLADGAAHGYAIAREIDRRCDGDLVLRDGALYPALRVLEEEGLVVGEWENPPGGGPPRRTYRLTDVGRAERVRRADSWRRYARNVERILTPAGGASGEPAL